ncbi:unnamed protein product [Bursaphelenchus okinawaensis]|uniref:RING-type domain-containing protein n=1 Tax=Bursaphelenchus okinawaensis TaxID=465554 RepID=A0A811KQW7_9BILA|nr:unnamed protein product [Bursaphelenchus okinawaensis]CAG9107780.1 unnamed protein product [Bursaphelenchus okinawaensis]
MKVARIDSHQDLTTIRYGPSLQPHFFHSQPSTSKFRSYVDIFNSDRPLYDHSSPICYICYEDTPTVVCRYCEQKVGCKECVQNWSRSKWNSYEETTCPLCRVEWPNYYEGLNKK